jgi:hypothetical protein
LPAADESGKSDPVLTIADCDSLVSTHVVYDSVNPIFFQCIQCEYEANSEDLSEFPPIIVDIFDEDDGVTGPSYDFLARAKIILQDENPSRGDVIPKPKWYPLYFKTGGEKSGEVLMSFVWEEDDYPFKIPKKSKEE